MTDPILVDALRDMIHYQQQIVAQNNHMIAALEEVLERLTGQAGADGEADRTGTTMTMDGTAVVLEGLPAHMGARPPMHENN